MPSFANDFLYKQSHGKQPVDSAYTKALSKLFYQNDVLIKTIAKQFAGPLLKDEEQRSVVWALVQRCVEQVPFHNDKLIKLMLELQKLPGMEDHLTDLSGFKSHWMEFAFQTIPAVPSDEKYDAKRRGWIGLNEFTAKLSAFGIDQLDNSRRAPHVILNALEYTPYLTFHHQDLEEQLAEEKLQEDDDEDSEEDSDDEDTDSDSDADSGDEDYPDWMWDQLERRDIRFLDWDAPAAAQWILHDGQALWEKCKKEETIANDRKTDLWQREPIFSRERWELWRQRFEFVASVTVLRRDTKRWAREAASRMQAITAAEKTGS